MTAKQPTKPPLTNISGKRTGLTDLEQEFNSRIEALERRVECLECAIHDTAEWAMLVEQRLADIAKHVGLKPAPGPETPEAL